MDANPAATAGRLERAERLVTAAAAEGALLVLLPELFNTGYGYSDDNYDLAEAGDGPTVRWMQDTAARLGIHLAGSLMLLDQTDIYNAMLLFAPDGRMWRYDKNYAWGWERNYFRGRRGVTVAGTDLGDLGMMVCWDTGHADMWRRYAGQVDMLLISSCPPDVGNPTYHLPGGRNLTLADLGRTMASLKTAGQAVFGEGINRQAAWLKVPALHSVATGEINTKIPNGLAAVAGLIPFSPRMVRYLPQARELRMSCPMVPGCRVIGAGGEVLAELTPEQGESFVVTEVTLPAQKLFPAEAQPAMSVPRLIYLLSDILLPLSSIRGYNTGVRRVRQGPAPAQNAAARRRILVVSLLAAAAVGLGVAVVLGRRRGYKK
jgi:predicted amidohydrolase